MVSMHEQLGLIPTFAVDVVERDAHAKRGCVRCEIGENIEFSTADLESYLFAAQDPVVYDALLVAAAVEFADRTLHRPALTWHRGFVLRIPVHDPGRWRAAPVSSLLRDTLAFLTGDRWELSFYERRRPLDLPMQEGFSMPDGSLAVIPFSDGLDSRAVAGLMEREMGDKLVRVRLGSKDYDGHHPRRQPFMAIPYRVRPGQRKFVESSARSRGFKFALISGLAAYLAKARQVIVPESGQGALGPALVAVGQAYEDYRNHPLFTGRMEGFLKALLDHDVHFRFPRLWHTKGETLRQFVDECKDGPSWKSTWSCWQQNRHASVDHKRRHCGICAACMLRRMSVHAAGLNEAPETYVWENLAARTFDQGAATSFDEKKRTRTLREYAIAGVLHMDHLAGLRSSPANAGVLRSTAFKLSRSLAMDEAEARAKLDRLLGQHEREWTGFLDSLGDTSFVADWALGAR